MSTFIYALYDPRDPLIIRYVGKSGDVDRRLRGHIKAAQKNSKIHSHQRCWIRSLLKQDVQPKVIIIEKAPSKNWQIRECFWIREYRNRNHPLTNSTDGGDGGVNPTSEMRERMSAAQRRRVHFPCSEETKKKISDAQRGKPRKLHSEETRKKMSLAQRGKIRGPISESHRHNLSLAHRGIVYGPHSIETRNKISKSLQTSRKAIEQRQKVADAQRGAVRSLETRRKMRLGWALRRDRLKMEAA